MSHNRNISVGAGDLYIESNTKGRRYHICHDPVAMTCPIVLPKLSKLEVGSNCVALHKNQQQNWQYLCLQSSCHLAHQERRITQTTETISPVYPPLLLRCKAFAAKLRSAKSMQYG